MKKFGGNKKALTLAIIAVFLFLLLAFIFMTEGSVNLPAIYSLVQ